MTGFTVPTTMALTINDLVFYGFMVVFIAGPWIAKTIKQSQERSKRSDRRRQLEQSAQQRRQATSPASAQATQTDPTNLTMAQRIERARDQAAYQKRAEQLRGQSPGVSPNSGAIPDEIAPLASRPRPAATRRQHDLINQADQQATVVHRKVADAKPPPQDRPRVLLGHLNKGMLRRAIVLKELLDRPIALRDSTGAADRS